MATFDQQAADLYVRYCECFGDLMIHFKAHEASGGVPAVHYAVVRHTVINSDFSALAREDFVGHIGVPNESALYFVSERIPSVFQPYVVFHEMLCEGRNDDQGCVDAFRQELAVVPADKKRVYLIRRLAYYEALVEYYNGKPEYQVLLAKIQIGLKFLYKMVVEELLLA